MAYCVVSAALCLSSLTSKHTSQQPDRSDVRLVQGPTAARTLACRATTRSAVAVMLSVGVTIQTPGVKQVRLQVRLQMQLLSFSVRRANAQLHQNNEVGSPKAADRRSLPRQAAVSRP